MPETLNNYPDAVEELIEHLRKLPGIGRRGAERMALAMLKMPAEELQCFGETLRGLHDHVGN